MIRRASPLVQSTRTHPSTSGIATSTSRSPLSRRFRSTVCAAAMEPSEARILVAGGSGVALKTAQRLRDASANVYVLQRSTTRSEAISAMGATMVMADVLERDQVDKLYDGIEALDIVISSVGGTPADPLVDAVGNINLIEGAVEKGVKKFILVTSIGVAESKDAVSPNIYEVLEPVLLSKEKAEQRLKECGDKMSYIIIRPGGLKSEGATGNGVLTEDISICGSIQREDVAELITKCVFSDKPRNIVLSAVDKNALFGEPSFVEYIP